VGVAPLPLPFRLAIWLVLALSLSRLLRRQHFPTELKLCPDGRLFLVRDGDNTECRIDAGTTVFPWLVVLRLRTNSGTEALVLPVDALSAERHRQLRSWLRWQANVDPG
jgi:hypothetical protein